jgi:hypothetical protein
MNHHIYTWWWPFVAETCHWIYVTLLIEYVFHPCTTFLFTKITHYVFQPSRVIFRCYEHMALLLYHTNTHLLCLSRVVDSTHIHFQHYDVLLLTVGIRHILFFTLIYILCMGLFMWVECLILNYIKLIKTVECLI